MNDLSRRPLPHMTAEEFLAWPGDGSGRAFQLIDGEVRPTAPASSMHSIIQGELIALPAEARKAAGLSFRIMPEGAMIPGLNPAINVRVPDIAVMFSVGAKGQRVAAEPVLLIEILSPSNRSDTRANVRSYVATGSAREIAVIDSARILAEVHRRDAAGEWRPPERIGAGGRLRLDTVALDCPIEAAYEGTWLVEPPPGRMPA